MLIGPPTYKTRPYAIQFNEMAADWRRGNDAARANGAKKCHNIPAVMLDTGIRAGITHEGMRAALGISSNTLSRAISRAGLKMPRSASDRVAFMHSTPLLPEEEMLSEVREEEQASVDTTSPRQKLADATGIVSAWLAEKAVNGQAVQPDPVVVEVAPEPASADWGLRKTRIKTSQLAEAVARRLIGADADTHIPGTYTGKDGQEKCDALVGKGPAARPIVWAWREKAVMVEDILRLCREVQTDISGEAAEC